MNKHPESQKVPANLQRIGGMSEYPGPDHISALFAVVDDNFTCKERKIVFRDIHASIDKVIEVEDKIFLYEINILSNVIEQYKDLKIKPDFLTEEHWETLRTKPVSLEQLKNLSILVR